MYDLWMVESNQNNTENLGHDHKSKESKLKSQNEGWNLGGHPRLPYFYTQMADQI